MILDRYGQCKYKMQMSLTRKKSYEGTHTRHKQHADKNHSNMNNKKNEIK